MREPGLFFNFMVALVPAKHEQQIRDVLNDISTMLTRYFGGVALQIFLIAVYVSIFLSILGVKNAILIGFFAALMNLIPYLGPALGGGIGILISVSANLDADFTTVILPMMIKVLVVFWTVQMLDNYFLTPYIFSSTVLAHPLEIFITILVGAKIGGVVGMVLAIPAYTVLRVVAREFLSRFKIVKRITGRLDEAIPDDKVKNQNE
ncbi:MAG: AI-2E family transporter [Saprospiraceae bacterium]|nr:AI-2E family transporter [Saprospiraceae bacterium]